MSEHHITLSWSRADGPFERGHYAREHSLRFEGGQTLENSAAGDFGGAGHASNPEELLAAALSSCHMLTFLAVAAKRKFSLESYEDAAVGVLEKNADGKLAITRVTLRPKIVWSSGVSVSSDDLAKLHHDAHEGCFIANSVKTEVAVEPRP